LRKLLNINDYYELCVVVSEHPLLQKEPVTPKKVIHLQKLQISVQTWQPDVFSLGTAFLLVPFF